MSMENNENVNNNEQKQVPNPEQKQVYERCKRCRRKLTKPDSKLRGYGDSCWKKVNKGLLNNP